MRNITFALGTMLAMMVAAGCSSGDKELERISSLQIKVDSLLSEKPVLGPTDRELVNELVNEYLVYAEANPEDSLASAYTFEAAGLKARIPDMEACIELYTLVYENYPDSRYAPLSMMAVGGIYDVTLGKPDIARPVYEMLLEKYPLEANEYGIPNTLKTLGLSPEESLELIMGAVEEGEVHSDKEESIQ